MRGIRERHADIKVVGSLDLVQTLLREKLFAGGEVPTNLTLLEPPVAGAKGTVFLRYGLAGGTPGTGDMSRPGRGVDGGA